MSGCVQAVTLVREVRSRNGEKVFRGACVEERRFQASPPPPLGPGIDGSTDPMRTNARMGSSSLARSRRASMTTGTTRHLLPRPR